MEDLNNKNIDRLKKRIEKIRIQIEGKSKEIADINKKLISTIEKIELLEDRVSDDVLNLSEDWNLLMSQEKNKKKEFESELLIVKKALYGTIRPKKSGLIEKLFNLEKKLKVLRIGSEEKLEKLEEKDLEKRLTKIEKMLKEKLRNTNCSTEEIEDNLFIYKMVSELTHNLSSNRKSLLKFPTENEIKLAINDLILEKGYVNNYDLLHEKTKNKILLDHIIQNAGQDSLDKIKNEILANIMEVIKVLKNSDVIKLKKHGYYKEIGAKLSLVYRKYESHFGRNKQIFIDTYYDTIRSELNLEEEQLIIESFERYI